MMNKVKAEPKKKDAHWIEHSGMKKGALKKDLHVPANKKIGAKKIEKAMKSHSPVIQKRAVMARTLSGLRK